MFTLAACGQQLNQCCSRNQPLHPPESAENDAAKGSFRTYIISLDRKHEGSTCSRLCIYASTTCASCSLKGAESSGFLYIGSTSSGEPLGNMTSGTLTCYWPRFQDLCGELGLLKSFLSASTGQQSYPSHKMDVSRIYDCARSIKWSVPCPAGCPAELACRPKRGVCWPPRACSAPPAPPSSLPGPLHSGTPQRQWALCHRRRLSSDRRP